MTKTKTFWEHLPRAILETCDLSDIWSEWWGDNYWQLWHLWQLWQLLTSSTMFTTKRQQQQQRQWQRQSWDLWHLRHNSDNWEPEFMFLFTNGRGFAFAQDLMQKYQILFKITGWWLKDRTELQENGNHDNMGSKVNSTDGCSLSNWFVQGWLFYVASKIWTFCSFPGFIHPKSLNKLTETTFQARKST